MEIRQRVCSPGVAEREKMTYFWNSLKRKVGLISLGVLKAIQRMVFGLLLDLSHQAVLMRRRRRSLESHSAAPTELIFRKFHSVKTQSEVWE